MGNTVRRLATTFVVAAVGGFVMTNPGGVKAFYEKLYPSDPAKREALDLCFLRDHQFNRLIESQREDCYRQAFLPLKERPVEASNRQPLNLVDLQQAAAMGSVPRNDVRRTEETEKAVHRPH